MPHDHESDSEEGGDAVSDTNSAMTSDEDYDDDSLGDDTSSQSDSGDESASSDEEEEEASDDDDDAKDKTDTAVGVEEKQNASTSGTADIKQGEEESTTPRKQ